MEFINAPIEHKNPAKFHSQACYTSRNVTEEIEKSKDVSENFVQENSELLECVVKI